MSNHTPGPWEWGVHFCGLHGLNGRAILEFEDYEGMRFEGSDADANLIAAAPDLLEALDRLTKWAEVMAEAQTCEHTGDHPIAIARAALIKALTGATK